MIEAPPDTPLDPRPDAKPFVSEVIDLDGIRIQWGLPRRGLQTCEHKSIVYSTSERRVWCEDCKRTIDNFDAFMIYTMNFEKMARAIRIKQKEADDALASVVRRRATKRLDHAWSSGLPAVCCPHCRKGLLPEDFADGLIARTSLEYEMARRGKEKP